MSGCSVEDSKIKHDSIVFKSFVAQARFLLDKGSNSASAVCAKIAAEYAAARHPGVFVNPELEAVLEEIGCRTMQDKLSHLTHLQYRPERKHIVHVISFARPLGGDTRYLWRWIEKDKQRSHSVVITGVQREKAPVQLCASVEQSGGDIFTICADITDPIQRAQILRDYVSSADLIVLHLYPEDILPQIAFANRENFPPVVFVFHADERFWMGFAISDVFVHMRESGILLAKQRSGINADRICLLPIPLPPRQRSMSREDAKRKIGLPRNSVVLLSIARGMKYKKMSGVSFLEAITPIIERHENVVMLVIGHENRGQWEIDEPIAHDRIRSLGRISDTEVYYEAADIYLDSFPFSSNTSLLEAGTYGLPLVSYFPHSASSGVLGAGSPGIDEALQRFTDLDAYRNAVTRLIENPEIRLNTGELGKNIIINNHGGPAWDTFLEKLYEKAFAIDRNNSKPHTDFTPPEELDIILNRLYSHINMTEIIERNVGPLPLQLRIRVLSRLVRVDRSFSFGLFLPYRIAALLRPFLGFWRNIPFIEKWVNVGA